LETARALCGKLQLRQNCIRFLRSKVKGPSVCVLGGPHITRASARPQTTPVTPDPGRRAYPHAPRVPHALLTPIYILTIARRGTALRTTATSRDEPHTGHCHKCLCAYASIPPGTGRVPVRRGQRAQHTLSAALPHTSVALALTQAHMLATRSRRCAARSAWPGRPGSRHSRSLIDLRSRQCE